MSKRAEEAARKRMERLREQRAVNRKSNHHSRLLLTASGSVVLVPPSYETCFENFGHFENDRRSPKVDFAEKFGFESSVLARDNDHRLIQRLIQSDTDREWSVSSDGEFAFFRQIKVAAKLTYVGYDRKTGQPSGYVEDGIEVRSSKHIHDDWIKKINHLEIKV